MASKPVQEATQQTRMELTPMIDVTFLLLIFFLCSIKFKVLEGKLQTYLPKETGLKASPITEYLDKIDIAIFRTADRGVADLDNVATFGAWKEKGWDIDQVQIFYQGTRVQSLAQLQSEFESLRGKIPPPSPGEEDDLKMNIEAMSGVIYEDVIKVVDVAIDSGFTSITFRGIDKDA